MRNAFQPISVLTGVAIIFACARVAGASEAHRKQFGASAATALEEVVERRYPGSKIQWRSAPRLVGADGDVKDLLLSGFVQRPEPGNKFLFVTVWELSDPKPPETPPVGSLAGIGPEPRVVIYTTTREGTLLDLREGVLDPTAESAKCGHVSFTDWPTKRIEVFYRGSHSGGGVPGAIEWKAVYDLDGMKIRERLPRWIEKAGATPSNELLRLRQVGDAIEIRGVDSGKSVLMKCPEPCVLDGRDLLARWPLTPTPEPTLAP